MGITRGKMRKILKLDTFFTRNEIEELLLTKEIAGLKEKRDHSFRKNKGENNE